MHDPDSFIIGQPTLWSHTPTLLVLRAICCWLLGGNGQQIRRVLWCICTQLFELVLDTQVYSSRCFVKNFTAASKSSHTTFNVLASCLNDWIPFLIGHLQQLLHFVTTPNSWLGKLWCTYDRNDHNTVFFCPRTHISHPRGLRGTGRQ